MRLFGLIGAALALTLVLPSPSSGQAHFIAELDALQEVPPGGSTARGTAHFTLIGSDLYYALTVEGLTGAVVAAHLHGARRGVNGPVAFDLGDDFFGPIDAATSTAHGVVEGLTAAQISALMGSGFYVNIHTAANPAGEIRGQVDIAGGTHFLADLMGTQENPPVGAPGSGTGSFQLTDEGLRVDVTVTDLSGPITAAHIHGGETGTNGAPVFDLTPSVSGFHIETIWPRGAGGLTDALLAELLTGRLYLNVHTAANPSGELRGQIQVASGFGLHAKIDGGQEVPPVASPGEGTAVFTLTPAGLVFDITHSGIPSPITGAHIHRGAAGSNGPVVRDLTGDFVGNTATGVWSDRDSQPLTQELICSLLSGDLYVNIHSMANPGGEIRGQIIVNADASSLTATLSGFEEQPPSGAAGRGTASFRIGSAGVDFDISVDGLTGGITGAHIHDGEIGTNGGVIINLTASFVGNHARGSFVPTVAQAKSLLQGEYYLNVHTAANPGGEIRGQIELSSGAGFDFPLTGAQENPPVATQGIGTGAATLTREGLVFNGTVDALNGAFTVAHIHQATTGANGGVVRDLTPAFVSTHVEDVWSPGDPSPLTPALIDALLLGNLYVNVHSSTSPGGEVRGQLLHKEGFFADMELLGGNEVPPVSTNGMGSGAARLSENVLVYGLSFDNLDGAFTVSHIHRAPPGANGPVVLDITSSYINQTARGTWRSTGAVPLTTGDVCDFLAGELYVNVHSSLFPAGELRGNFFELVPTSVDDEMANQSRLFLQARPNPTAAQTAFVDFELPESGPVVLTLHDASGRLVMTLQDEMMFAGAQRVRLPADLAGGLYFVRLRTETTESSAKWMVLR